MSSSILRRLGAGAAVAAAALAVAPAAHAASGSVTVSATARDNDTGTNVTRGQILTASVTSDFSFCNATLYECNNGNVEHGDAGVGAEPLRPDYGLGGVFYKIGDGPWRPFTRSTGDRGVSTPIVAAQSGRLQLATNDGCEGCYGDNTGSMTVDIADSASTVEVVRNADVFRAFQAGDTTYFPDGYRYSKADTRAPAAPTFEFGPADPPLGKGSYRITTADGSAKGQIMSNLPSGDRLSTLTALSYQAYRRSTSTGQPFQTPAINIVIDFNGPADGGYDQLVYEPVYQSGGAAGVQSDIWQTWDAVNDGQAVYWSTRAINGQPAGADPGNRRTLDQIVANNPDATITYLGINQGSGNPGIDANVDALRIQSGGKDVTADLEPDVPMLNSYKASNSGAQPTVTASGDLAPGATYNVTITGTSSTFAPALMAVKPTKGWAVCGTPESGPVFASPGITNGRSGADPEFLFAFPQLGTKCSAKNLAALPKRQSGLKFSLNGGSTFAAPVANGVGSVPAADHTYTYTVIGQGKPLQVRFPDSSYTDNSGQYRVEVAAATIPSA